MKLKVDLEDPFYTKDFGGIWFLPPSICGTTLLSRLSTWVLEYGGRRLIRFGP